MACVLDLLDWISWDAKSNVYNQGTGASFIWGKAERVRTAQPGEEKTHGGCYHSVSKWLLGETEGEGARLFSVAPSERTRGDGPELKYMKLNLNTTPHTHFFYCEGVQALARMA